MSHHPEGYRSDDISWKADSAPHFDLYPVERGNPNQQIIEPFQGDDNNYVDTQLSSTSATYYAQDYQAPVPDGNGEFQLALSDEGYISQFSPVTEQAAASVSGFTPNPDILSTQYSSENTYHTTDFHGEAGTGCQSLFGTESVAREAVTPVHRDGKQPIRSKPPSNGYTALPAKTSASSPVIPVAGSRARGKSASFPCEQEGCDDTFTSPKDRDRHRGSVHDKDGSGWVCRCLQKTPRPRKDNFLRHLRHWNFLAEGDQITHSSEDCPTNIPRLWYYIGTRSLSKQHSLSTHDGPWC
ncbi:hypothetical protein V8F20_004136 [Naviculisporaceae sp. PSN 640]